MSAADDPPVVVAFKALVAALGLTLHAPEPRRPRDARRYSAEGEIGGFAVSLGHLWANQAEIPIRIETRGQRDLQLEVFTRRPRHVFQQIDAERLGELWVRGPGHRDRLHALLAGDVGDRLRALAGDHVQLQDRAVLGFLAAGAGVPALIAELDRLIALAAAVDAAAARVPVDPDARWAVPRFTAAAAALGLTFTPCAIGLSGELGGCRITTHSLFARDDRRILIHVALCHVIPGRWVLRAQGRSWWPRLRGAVGALFGRGPGSGRFAFDRRFYVDGDRGDAVRAVAAHLAPLIAFADRDWLSVSGKLVLVGFRFTEAKLPDLAELLPRAVAIAHLVGGAPTPVAPIGPFR